MFKKNFYRFYKKRRRLLQTTFSTTYKPSFKAGLTSKIINEVKSTNVANIETNLLEKGIIAGFQDDKISAFCVSKLVEIIQIINKKFKTNFELPKAVFVDDFEKLNIENKKLFAFTNFLPAKLKQGCGEVFSEQTIFLNNRNFKSHDIETNLKNLNALADRNYSSKFYSGDLFFHNYIHEFSHCAHEGAMRKKMTAEEFVQRISKIYDEKSIAEFQTKYGKLFTDSPIYSQSNQLELIADELSRLFELSLNVSTLEPQNNSFKNSFLNQNKIFTKINSLFSDDKNLKNKNRVLYDFWSGRFD